MKDELEFLELQTKVSSLCMFLSLADRGGAGPIASLWHSLCPAPFLGFLQPQVPIHLSAPATPPLCRDSKPLKQRWLSQQWLSQQIPP